MKQGTEDNPILWTKEKSIQFRNALCGLPKEVKMWQDYYDVGDMEGVFRCWEAIAEREKYQNPERKFWTVIMEMIDYKIKQAVQAR